MKLAMALVGLVVGVGLTVAQASTVAAPGGELHPVRGQVEAFRMAGIEPDGDPIDQVVLKFRLAASPGEPASNLIVDAYLENFQPDTTPILPDLLHPNHTAQNLGGFLQGKALLVDDAGHVLQIGSFLAEAFLNNTNHAVMRLSGSGGSEMKLRGSFELSRKGSATGTLGGTIKLTASEVQSLQTNAGATMRPLKEIVKTVTVHPAPMMGRSTKGNPKAALHTGFGKGRRVDQPKADAPAGRHVPMLSLVLGAAAVLSMMIALGLFVLQRGSLGRDNPDR
ncbi:MAG: hypothetical protein ACRDFS_12035 [Chloroflexota bacterium]